MKNHILAALVALGAAAATPGFALASDPAPKGSAAPPARPAAKGTVAQEVAGVVAKVQAFYEKSQGFDTRFEQSFAQAGIPSRLGNSKATGRMRFRKPAGGTGPLMRWDYDDGRILLLVKDRSWTYDPDTKQATEYAVDAGQLSAAVTFMWGKGRLADEFSIAPSSRSLGEGVALELTPIASGGGFSKVHLLVDPATGQVSRSIVVQSNGSENDLTFRNAAVKSDVNGADFDPAKAFPAGTARVKAAVPGR
ncbi:MAG TPA: outer membrane lipoprotein carrier protein LolA [Vulgatibacter sp.]